MKNVLKKGLIVLALATLLLTTVSGVDAATKTKKRTKMETPSVGTYRITGRVYLKAGNRHINIGQNGYEVLLKKIGPGQERITTSTFTTNYQGAPGAFVFNNLTPGIYQLCTEMIPGAHLVMPYEGCYDVVLDDQHPTSLYNGFRFVK